MPTPARQARPLSRNCGCRKTWELGARSRRFDASRWSPNCRIQDMYWNWSAGKRPSAPVKTRPCSSVWLRSFASGTTENNASPTKAAAESLRSSGSVACEDMRAGSDAGAPARQLCGGAVAPGAQADAQLEAPMPQPCARRADRLPAAAQRPLDPDANERRASAGTLCDSAQYDDARALADPEGQRRRTVPFLDHALRRLPARRVIARRSRRRVGGPIPPVHAGDPRLGAEHFVERLVRTRLRPGVERPVPADLVRLDRRPVAWVVADLGEEDRPPPTPGERLQPVHVAAVVPRVDERGHGRFRIVRGERHVRVHANEVECVPEVDRLGLLEAVGRVCGLA